jgi:hypothetical protein
MRLLIALLFTTLFSINSQAATTEWELELEEDKAELKIYTREIEGSSLKEFKGEMLVDTTLSTIVSLMLDSDAAPEWMHQCEKFEVVERVEENHLIIHFINGAPWPVSDRDAVVSSKMYQNPETLEVRIDVKALTDYLPEDDDFVRIPRMAGFWSFTPQADKVLVRYQVYAEPGGSLPAWLANSVVVDTPQYTMLKMLDMLQLDKYKQAEISFIKNSH